MAGFAVGLFPRLLQARNIQVGDGKAGQACFGREPLPVAPRRGFHRPHLLPHPQTARMAGRVVVCFHFHDDMGVFFVETVALVFRRIRIETLDFCAFNHGRIVFIGNDCASGCALCVSRIMPKRDFGCFSPLRMKSALKILWAAVFAVCLSEHH